MTSIWQADEVQRLQWLDTRAEEVAVLTEASGLSRWLHLPDMCVRQQPLKYKEPRLRQIMSNALLVNLSACERIWGSPKRSHQLEVWHDAA